MVYMIAKLKSLSIFLLIRYTYMHMVLRDVKFRDFCGGASVKCGP